MIRVLVSDRMSACLSHCQNAVIGMIGERKMRSRNERLKETERIVEKRSQTLVATALRASVRNKILLWAQQPVSADAGLPLHAPWYQSLPVSCHFRGCKVPLFRTVSGAISSELASPLPLPQKICSFERLACLQMPQQTVSPYRSTHSRGLLL